MVAVLGVGGLAGQSVETEGTIQTSFTVFSAVRRVPEDLYFMELPGKPKLLVFERGQRSFPFEYRGLSPLRFYRKGLAEDGVTPVYETVGEVPVERGIDAYLVFFFVREGWESEANQPEYRLLGMDDSSRALPVDHVRFVNATGAPLLGVVGDREIELKVGANPAIDLRPYYDKPVPIGLVVKNGETFEEVLVTKYRFYPESRNIFLLTPPPKKGSFRILARHIIDFSERAEVGEVAEDGSVERDSEPEDPPEGL